jgi:hypothetical protein
MPHASVPATNGDKQGIVAKDDEDEKRRSEKTERSEL